MTSLYLTADRVGDASGGGVVTFHESLALAEMGEKVQLVDRNALLYRHASVPLTEPDPWMWDEGAQFTFDKATQINLAHVYSGTFSRTVKRLKDLGVKVTYTIAAHSIEESRREFEVLYGEYPFPHLTDPELWKRYSEGYKLADRVIVPSPYSAEVVKAQGICENPVVIPHGCYEIHADRIQPLPKRFAVGYLGAYGPDKGVIYLLQAWKKLNYRDATLILGGKESCSPYVSDLIRRYGGGNIYRAGWYNEVSDFYNSISLYVQPSVTEGFGIECLEAQAYARPVLCSTGAGAHSYVPRFGSLVVFPARDVNWLADSIDAAKRDENKLVQWGQTCRNNVKQFTWDKIEKQYKDTWKSL